MRNRLHLDRWLTSRAALAIMLAIAGASMAAAGEIRFRHECRPAGTLVVLGDLAEIDLADEQQAKKLAAMELFPAPGAGQRRFLRLPEIRELIELRSFELTDCRLGGASLIVIHGPPPKAAPEPALEAKPTADLAATPPRAAAPITAPAEAAQPEPVVLAVAAMRPLERGQVIQPADVQLASFPAAAMRDGLLHELELAVGQEATRQFAPGQPLESRALRKPLLVQRRDAVRVAVIAPGVRLSIDAIAHEEGGEGDWILIETPHSKDKIRARVCGLKQVEVHAGPAAGEATPN